MRPGRSRGAALAAFVGACLLSGTPATAKIPPFSVEVRPSVVAMGDPVSVVVRLWNDTEHTQPGPAWPRFVPGLWAYPLEGDGTVDVAAGVKLVPKQRGLYRMVDRFRPRRSGDWVVIPFGQPSHLPGGRVPTPGPGVTSYGFAAPMFFHVEGPLDRAIASPRSTGRSPLGVPLFLAVVAITMIAVLPVVRRRGPSSPARAAPGP